jgi:hypothetical protein
MSYLLILLTALCLTAIPTPLRAQPAGALMLACTGTTVDELRPLADSKPEPISRGLIVDLAKRTVQGFEPPAEVTRMDDVIVEFDGSQKIEDVSKRVSGTIDRITGDVVATETARSIRWKESYARTRYALKCKPAQRMM